MRTIAFSLLFAASSAALAAPYTVPPGAHGKVRFRVEGPLDDVTGQTSAVSGLLELDSAKWWEAKGFVAVELLRLRTGIDQRDEDMREEFLQSSRFPYAQLYVDKIERPSSQTLAAGQKVQAEAVGSFQIHGQRRAVRVPIELRVEGDGKLWAKGAFDVVFADYGIQRPQRLFFKLGEVARVDFEVLFAPSQVEKPAPAPTPPVAEVLPAGPKPKAKPPRKPKPVVKSPFLFTGNDARARGEKLVHDAKLGSNGNTLSCAHCHAVTDERLGLLQKDGYVRAASSLYGSAQRPRFWNGFASDVGKASDICIKMYMGGKGLTEEQRKDLTAFLEADSPDPQPEHDYRVLYRTYDSDLRDPLGGDPARGKKLGDKYCMVCHLEGRAAPPWAVGLYEADWLVRRVRHLEGHGDQGMPPFSISRLSDSELRDIVTYLASSKRNPPIFDRSKRKSAAKPK